ncbi:phosphatidylserine decarboxylase [candidate division KSB3 bacterium]|uniref:Phosphatidylserine decarboxylase proenzyme n=1 Tax=candidate division KSB3 bacterium TaxID=2044937 RepID=A0A2G6KAM7_9BACT|nr:MAG: phosphatidylserine decarboxylase [candidate division KSB3 bacterium]
MKNIRYIHRATGEIHQEIVPGEKWLQWLYHNPFGRLALQAVVKRKFLSRWYGKKMDAPASRAKIVDFITSLQIEMDEALRPVDEFQTFNEFFIRQLEPDARPIDMNPDVIVSPADGKVLAFDDMRRLDTFFAKGQEFSLNEFLAEDRLKNKYIGGNLLIIRLAPADYHRFHFPMDGQISRSTPVNGDYYSVSPYAVKKHIRIYWENKREYSILSTVNAGDIFLCEVGATMVGSIVQSYIPETVVKKGQEKGWFKFGGSTIIVLLEKDRVQIDRDILDNTNNGYETSIKMGEHLATAF